MSDSSEDEDLSRFKEVVDTSYINFLQGAGNKPQRKMHKFLYYLPCPILVHLPNPKPKRYQSLNFRGTETKIGKIFGGIITL